MTKKEIQAGYRALIKKTKGLEKKYGEKFYKLSAPMCDKMIAKGGGEGQETEAFFDEFNRKIDAMLKKLQKVK